MQRGIRAVRAHFASLTLRVIEDHRRSRDTTPEGINRATSERLAKIRRVFFLSKGHLRPKALRLPRFHGSTTNPINEETGDGHRLIANHPRWKPIPRTTCMEAIARILFQGKRINLRRLTINPAGDDRFDELLKVPSGLHEISRQPVEKLGVHGNFTLNPEVLRALHQADTKEFLPQTIGSDSRGERIFSIHQPAGKVEPGRRTLGIKRR